MHYFVLLAACESGSMPRTWVGIVSAVPGLSLLEQHVVLDRLHAGDTAGKFDCLVYARLR